jgi:putative DNA primase/helicase
VERVTGSLAFAALARVVMVAAKLPDDRRDGDPARMIARAKSNISRDSGGFGYDIEHDELDGYPGVGASRVMWGAAVDGSARELLARAEQVDEDGGAENAREFLRAILASGPISAAQAIRDGEANGFSRRQMQRACKAIRARVEKMGMKDGWQWSLPKVPIGSEDTEDAEQGCLAPSAPSAAADAYRRVRG